MTNVEQHSNEWEDAQGRKWVAYFVNGHPPGDTTMNEDECRESAERLQREEAWLEDWINGDLVEQRGDRFYSNPVDRVMEGDGINYLADMLRLKRAGYLSAMSNLACLLLDDLEREIRKDTPSEEEK